MDEGIVFLTLICLGLGMVWVGIENMEGKRDGSS